MSHLAMRLPEEVEIGCVRTDDYEVEIVETDGGHEVRNLRHANSKRRYEVSFPTSLRDGAVYQEVLNLYAAAKGKLHSFDLQDWTNGQIVPVRFDGSLQIRGVATHLDHIETINLVEVFL